MRWPIFAVVWLVGCSCGTATGAPCVRASDCAGGLACRAGACSPTCELNSDCAVGSFCLAQGMCSAVDEHDGGSDGGADAEIGDASVDGSTGADAGADADAGAAPHDARAGCIGSTQACVIADDGDVYCWGSACGAAATA